MEAIDFIKAKQNGILLKDYTLQDVEWFMIHYAKYYHKIKCNKIG